MIAFEIFFCFLSFLTAKYVMKGLTVSKAAKEIKFEEVWGELESKAGFQRQSFTKYLRLTLVLI